MSRLKQRFKWLARIAIGSGILIAILIVASAISNWSINPDSFYLLPRSGNDWAAWAGWIAALGTTGALIFAGTQFMAEQEELRAARESRYLQARSLASRLEIEVRTKYRDRSGEEVTSFSIGIANNTGATFSNIWLETNFSNYEVTESEFADKLNYKAVEQFGRLEQYPDFNWSVSKVGARRLRSDIWRFPPVATGTAFRATFKFASISDKIWLGFPDSPQPRPNDEPHITLYYRDEEGRLWWRHCFPSASMAELVPVAGMDFGWSHRD